MGSTSTIQHALRAYREITVTGRRQLFVTRFSKFRWDAASVQADFFVLSQVSKYTFEIGLVVGGGLLVGILATTRDTTAAVGTLTVFLLAAARMFPSMLRVQSMTVTVRNSAGLAEATFALLHDLDRADALRGTTPPMRVEPRVFSDLARAGYSGFVPEVAAEGVSLTYPNTTTLALDDVSVSVAEGASLALVGPTGAGKSTLADVLLGIVEPDAGTIRISGLTPSEVVSKWPGAMAYVPQDVAVVTGTIRENVALGIPRDDIDDELVWECLTRAHLAVFLRERREGLDTTVGEHGMKLSGGQRQRLGIARALYSRPRLVVLDEATSALDADTEASISVTLRELSGSVTVVIVAHRLATVRSCDELLYLEHGRVLGRGTFDSLRRQVPDFDRQAKLLGL